MSSRLLHAGAVYARMDRQEAVPVPESHREQVFYHGTPNTEMGEKIVRDGFLEVGETVEFDEDDEGSHVVPMEGKVYLTSSLEKSILYVIGDRTPYTRNVGDFGYLFVVEGSELSEVVPDEDVVGELVCKGTFPWLNEKAEEVYEYNEDEILELLDPEEAYGYDFWKRLSECEFNEVATIGKYLLYYLEDDEVDKLLQATDSLAHGGSVKIAEAWKFEKSLFPKLGKDSSNFFELAERVK